MIPKISETRQIILAGMSFYGDPFDTHVGWDERNHIGQLWDRFMCFLSRDAEFTHLIGEINATYEVHLFDDDTAEKGLFEVFVGVEIDCEKTSVIPVGLCLKTLPKTQYAVFTFQGAQIKSDWEKAIQDWLEDSGYQSCYSYNFQYYDDRFKGMVNLENSALDVYVPIQKAV